MYQNNSWIVDLPIRIENYRLHVNQALRGIWGHTFVQSVIFRVINRFYTADKNSPAIDIQDMQPVVWKLSP